jgi:two-component system CheB/CheR fusion protein
MAPPVRIIGIGASAGGIEALEAFFQAMPADAGLAFVVLVHLAPDHVSLLPEVLARRTSMPVESAVENQRVAANHVYVIPPGVSMSTANGRLHLKPRLTRHMPIDDFLISLSEDQGERAVGIILSGTGKDGTAGLGAIRAGGGVTMAQNGAPDEAQYPDMPDNAIASGAVIHAISIKEMTAILSALDRDEVSFDGASGDAILAAKTALLALLLRRTGHDFSGYKEKNFLRRVQRRVRATKLRGLPDYTNYLRGNPDETAHLFGDLLISVTHFFRDPESFVRLGELVPQLLAGKGRNDTVRVWVAGCATGQEAYSIAMILREAVDAVTDAPRIQVFATDIDAKAIRIARAGLFTASQVGTIGAERLERFFTKTADGYCVTKQLRELCIFSVHSLIKDPPLSRIDLLSCRNLLIYFDDDLQYRVIRTLHYALRPKGILFLGRSESVARFADLFAATDKRHRLFERREPPRKPSILTMMPSLAAVEQSRPVSQAFAHHAMEDLAEVVRTALRRYIPVHVVVTAEGDLIYNSAGIERFFELPAGQFSRQILSMARKGLRRALAASLHRAAKSGGRTVRDVVVYTNDGRWKVRLSVEPLGIGFESDYLMVLSDLGPADKSPRANGVGEAGGDLGLEQDLLDSQQQMRGFIEQNETAAEELRAANEEMLSTNEELQSSNEELETSKEELEAVNEELSSVNQELSDKIENLDQVNSDLRNIFESTRLATVFLDPAMRIRSYTPAVTEIFALRQGDVGRSLGDISCTLGYDALTADFAALQQKSEPLQRALASRDGRAHYLMRMLPYRTSGGAADGALLIFVDISAVVKAEEQERFQRLMINELNHRVRNILAVAISLAQRSFADPDGTNSQDAFVGRLYALASAHDLLSTTNWGDVPLHDLVQAEMAPHDSGGNRVAFGGPLVRMTPRTATTVSLIIHELATNAVKYGSLSNADGRLTIGWTITRDAKPAIDLRWTETGGPEVKPPSRRGFGSELVTQSVSYELNGTATLDYLPEGLRARIVLPLEDQFYVPGAETAISAPVRSPPAIGA